MTTPEDNNRPSDEAAGRSSRLADAIVGYVTANLTSVAWSSFIFSGGLIFLLYYAKENFWPDLDPDAAISLLAALALTGAVYFVVLSAGLVAPAVFWTLAVFREERFKPLWHRAGELDNRRALGWFWGMSLPVLAAFLGADRAGWRVPAFLITAAAAGAAVVWGLSIVSKRKPFYLEATKDKTTPSAWELVMLVTAGMFSWSWLALSWLILDKLAGGRMGEMGLAPAAVTAVLLLFLPWVVNGVTLFVPPRVTPVVWIACVGLATLLLLLVSLEATASIPNVAVRQLGLGNIERATLLVNYEGCLIIREAGRDLKCGDKEGLYRVDDVRIISRLGTTHYLSYKRGGAEVKFTLPSSAVLSWSKGLPAATPTPPPAQTPPAAATPGEVPPQAAPSATPRTAS